MLKKGFPALFQLGSSRSKFATACEHEQLGHGTPCPYGSCKPFMACLTRPLKMFFNGLLDPQPGGLEGEFLLLLAPRQGMPVPLGAALDGPVEAG